MKPQNEAPAGVATGWETGDGSTGAGETGVTGAVGSTGAGETGEGPGEPPTAATAA